MIQSEALLDSDTILFLTRRNPKVVARALAYEAVHGHFTISIVTRYEVLRGLLTKDARGQLPRFERFRLQNEVLPITEEIVVRAAGIYADLRKRGIVIGDADIFIAATALLHDLVVVTNNEKHFSRVPSIKIENWLT